MNTVKRALGLSPGPKSPTASHAQSTAKTTAPVGPQTNQCPAACKITPTFLSHTQMTCVEPAPMSLQPLHVDPSYIDMKSDHQPITLLSSFKEGEPSKQVTTLLERVQLVDPGSPNINEDNTCQSWGHYQFTAGSISPASSLTNWQEVGSVTTAFKLMVAAIKTCQEARLMCSNARMPKTSGFISDVYLEKTLECLENCWVGAGGAPMGTNSTNQPTTTMEPTRPSVGLDEGAHASAVLLRLLQVSELLAWFGDNNISALKGKHKDDLIAAIVKSPEFASISESTIKEIIEKCKKKGSQKPLAALP
ncbi:hypothetical protein H4582DRAFT_2058335 [Lactarius indigo]|nr:hypothetical protein H4582DRAFT_2058335 [Lactarius indigo]